MELITHLINYLIVYLILVLLVLHMLVAPWLSKCNIHQLWFFFLTPNSIQLIFTQKAE